MPLFYFFSTLVIIFSFCVILSKNPIYSVLSMVATFLCFSALYIILNAQFLAIVNFVVNMGAVMVLFLFTIMFIDFKNKSHFKIPIKLKKPGVLLIVLFMGTMLFFILYFYKLETNNITGIKDIGEVKKLGQLLFSQYLYPFEMVSILLIVAVIGAVLVTKKKPVSEH